MKSKLIILFLVFGTIGNAQHHISVVKEVRAKYPNLPGNREVTNRALREIASRIPGAGIYQKKTGNNCLGYSCDLICFKDAGYADVFRDWENTATPIWLAKTGIEPAKCELQNFTPIPEPCPPAGCETEKTIIHSLGTRVKELESQLKEWDQKLNEKLIEYDELKKKYDNVRCRGLFGLPCSIIK